MPNLPKFFLTAAALALSGAAFSQSSEPQEATTARLVVRFKPSQGGVSAQGFEQRASRMSTRAGRHLTHLKTLPGGAAVYRLERALPMKEARELALKMAQDPGVLSAEPDVRVFVQAALPNDSFAASQWAIQMSTAQNAGATNALGAWNYTTGANVVVAVLDTGILPHTDLAGKVMPGYDFVADASAGNDGGGRDADPSDPGDWCPATNAASSWHGTKVASQIAAIAGNGYGIAGMAPNAHIMPVRVLGACGGYLSDTAAGISWVAGVAISGIPAPSVQAKVINLSLSGTVACPSYVQDAVNAAVAKGIVVVAAAGNESASSLPAPANCQGVIAVGAHTKNGDLASYSNYSAQVALTAPGGGNCAFLAGAACDSYPTLASGNSGNTGPGTDIPSVYFSGTSAATPHVAATAALLLSAVPSMTPAQVRSALVNTARKHPSGTFCDVAGRCGAGMLDAQAAVLSVTSVPQLLVSASVASPLVARGATVSLSATAADGAPTFAWKQVSGAVGVLTPGVAGGASFTAANASGLVGFEVWATGSDGKTGIATVWVRVNSAPVVPGATVSGVALRRMAVKLNLTDVDGDTVVATVKSGPVGGSVVGDDLWWTPDTAQHAVFTIEAQDSFGQKTTGVYTVEVAQAGAPGTVGAPSVGSGGASSGGGAPSAVLVAGLFLAGVLRRRKAATA